MYPSLNNVPYPCTNWDSIIYHNESKLTLQNRNSILKFPFDDIKLNVFKFYNKSTFIGSSADRKYYSSLLLMAALIIFDNYFNLKVGDTS